jgi:murein L,D-transpeptidase YafK
MKRALAALIFIAPLLTAAPRAESRAQPHAKAAAEKKRAATPTRAKPPARRAATQAKGREGRDERDGQAEARLIEIYKFIGQGNSREALRKAEDLVRDHPNFQLAQLVYGDLLAGRTRAIRALGDVPDSAATNVGPVLAELRQESQQRLRALREHPAPGMVPSQYLTLAPSVKHAIAVDTSRSRLYLFENTTAGLKLVADYYISVGKLGIEKSVEGDQRTPLGVYFITSNLNPKSLRDFYGAGALPINYPNQLDIKRGKSGGGIWLHGTPPEQFSRAPLSTDGCVALANPDLERIIKTVAIGSTPVLIAQSLKWIAPQTLKAETQSFDQLLQGWQRAKSSGDMAQIMSWYTPDFTSFGKTLAEWTPTLQGEVQRLGKRELQLKDVSYMRWTDSTDTMVVTFGELVKGAKTGLTKRQYWTRQGNQWKIFFEGVL